MKKSKKKKDLPETEEVGNEEESKSIESKKQHSITDNSRIWIVSTAILLVLLIAAISFGVVNKATGGVVGNVNTATSDNSLTPKAAAEKAIDFISSYFQAAGQNTTVELVNATDTESGVYQFTVKLSSARGSVEQIYYVSKDGELFFPQGIKTSEIIEPVSKPEQKPPETVKSDRPEVHAFVMSYCPYGLQFMKAYIPVIELLGEKADLQLNFVDYAMHGKKELDENTRLYCIQKEQKDKFTKYLRCFVESGDNDKCVKEASIDAEILNSCVASTDEEYNITNLYNDKSTWSGGRFPRYPIDEDLNNEYGVRGSPTFVINGRQVPVNRSPEAIKEAICSAFNKPPEECNQTLSSKTENPGIGPIGSGGGSGSEGQC